MCVTECKPLEKQKNNPVKIKLRGIVKYAYKQMGKAIFDYRMLKTNDKVLVAVSGGKDSLSLLRLLKMRQARVPIPFEMMACFVDTSFIKIDIKRMKEHFQEEEVPYKICRLNLDPEKENVDCFWCSWNRRKLLFETAQSHGCNKIVMGHNLDDITETIMMNMAYFAEISAMKPYLDLFGGKLTLIRPLCYLEKKEIIRFFNKFDFPDLHYDCPVGNTSRRHAVRETIESLRQKCPYVKKNIFKSLKKIKKDYLV